VECGERRQIEVIEDGDDSIRLSVEQIPIIQVVEEASLSVVFGRIAALLSVPAPATISGAG